MTMSVEDNRWEVLENTITKLRDCSTAASAIEIVHPVAREIARADGITIVKRIGDHTDYLAEDAIEQLWAGMQFPIDKCLAGRAMTEEQTVLIPDITQVENIPLNVYLATFIRRLVAVPLGTPHPTHAICAYWREPGQIDPECVTLMEALCRALGAVLDMFDVTEMVAKHRLQLIAGA